MTQKEFEDRLDSNLYQVFLFSAPLPYPLNFAVHGWFVINLNGRIHRWDFGRFIDSPHPNKIGVLKDFIPFTTGLRKFPWNTKYVTESKLHGYISGPLDSRAEKMARFIENETPNYPLRDTYKLIGPNSNTYVKWVINHFSDCGFKLPWNAFGRNCKEAESNYLTKVTEPLNSSSSG
ncbi:MAG: DUF3750 domain-containing protein [Bacteroidota bacterium]